VVGMWPSTRRKWYGVVEKNIYMIDVSDAMNIQKKTRDFAHVSRQF
jgi:hypothetical protein